MNCFLSLKNETFNTLIDYEMKNEKNEMEKSGIYDIVKSNERFPEFMIFGEPTNNEILVGSKGLLELNISFNGVKAHSRNP